MSEIYTQAQYDIHFIPNRRNIVEIQLLDYVTERIVGKITGKAIDGSIDINNDNSIRRSCKLKLIADKSTIPDPNSYVWINRKIRVLAGIEDTNTGEQQLFNQGCYVLNNPKVNYSVTDKSLDVEALDYMSLYNGTLGGSIGYKVVIDAGGKVSEAIKSMCNVAGITKYKIEDAEYTIPYKIEKEETCTFYDVFKDLVDLYRNYELFFDETGTLVFQKIKTYISDPTIFDFSTNSDGEKLSPSFSIDVNSANVRNHVVVWGAVLSDSSQVKSEMINTNPNNPFSTVTLGETKTLVPNVDSTVQTQAQADAWCEYELNIHSNFNEKLAINCLNVYLLDVNKLINFNNTELKVNGRWLINSISLPLKKDSQMSINATKVYVVG